MAKDKEEMFSTNIRMPKRLAHKLAILSDSDDRSLNSYMVKALEEYVTDFEELIMNTYGREGYIEAYNSIFGEDSIPYIMFEDVSIEVDQVKSTIKNLMRGKQSTTKAYSGAPRGTGRNVGNNLTSDEAYEKERLRLENINNPDK